MNTLRQKWSLHRSRQRLRGLWTEYETASKSGNAASKREALTDVCQAFVLAHNDAHAAGQVVTSDSLFGDCKVLLTTVLEYLSSSEARDDEALYRRAVGVADLVLRDPSYADIAYSNKEVVASIVDHLDVNGDPELLQSILQLVTSLCSSQNTLDMIIELQAFRKVLPCLAKGSPELRHYFLLCLNRALSVSNARGSGLSSQDAFSIGAFTREKITGVFSSMRRVLERRVFSRDGSETGPTDRDLSEDGASDHASSVHDSIADGDAELPGTWALFPPPHDLLSEMDAHVDTHNGDTGDADISGLSGHGDSSSSRDQGPSKSGASAAEVGRDGKGTVSGEEERVHSLLIDQGVVDTLLSTLRDPTVSVKIKLELLETLTALSSHSKSIHDRISLSNEGFSTLGHMFDDCEELSSTDDLETKMRYVNRCFDAMFELALEGNPSRIVVNQEILVAAKVMLRTTDSTLLRTAGLGFLVDILATNGVNAVFFKQTGLIPVLLEIVQIQSEIPDDVLSPGDITCASMALQTLMYTAFLLAPINQDVVAGLSTVLAKPTVTRRARNMLLQGVSEILSDNNARRIGSSAHLLRPYVEMVSQFVTDHEPSAPRSRSSSYLHAGAAKSLNSSQDLDQLGIDGTGRKLSEINDPNQDALASFLDPGSQYRDSVSENCPSVGLSSTSVASLTEQTHEDSEQILRLLEIIGTIIEGDLTAISLLHELQGMTVFTDLISSPEVGSDVAQLALWLMQEFIVLGARHYDDVKYLDFLLNDPGLRDDIRLMVLRSMAAVMADESVGALIKDQFCMSGGLLSVLTICHREMDPEIVAAAFLTVAISITDCESNKRYLIGKPHVLAELLKASHVEHDVDFFIFLVELFTSGSVTGVFAPGQHAAMTAPPRSPSEDDFGDRPDIEQMLHRVLLPKMMYQSPLKASRQVLVRSPKKRSGQAEYSGKDGRTGSHRGSTTSHSEVLSTISDRRSDLGTDLGPGFSSRSSDVSENLTQMFENLFQLPTASESEVSTAAGAGGGKRGHHSRTSSRVLNSEMVDAVDVPSVEVADDPGTVSSPAVFLPQLTPIKFRSGEMALSILRSLEQVPGEVQLAVLQLLSLLLESNPHNRRAYCQVQGIQHLLNICNRLSEYAVQEGYLRLVASLGAYDLSRSGDASLLFHLALSPPSSASLNFEDSIDGLDDTPDLPFQMGMLDVISQVLHTSGPPGYFHFDGRDSVINLSLIEAIPAPKVGYTFCCWLRLYPMSSDQVVLLSMRDQLSLTHFELGFKMMGGAQSDHPKPYLFLRTQHVPSPPQTSLFDTFAFTDEAENGSCTNWFFVALTHNQESIALYVDGDFVQRHSLRSYFGDINKTNRLTGCIGRALDSAHPLARDLADDPQDSEQPGFCGELGALHFVEGVWDAETIQSVYFQGPLHVDGFKVKSKDAKEFLVIDPRACVPKGQKNGGDSVHSGQGSGPVSAIDNAGRSDPEPYVAFVREIPIGGYAMTEITKLFGSTSSNVPGQVPLLTERQGDNWKQAAEISSGVSVHQTVPLAEAVLNECGVRLCFLFLRANMNEKLQTRGLQVLLLLLEQSEAFVTEFIKSQGYATLLHLMRKSPSLLSEGNFAMLIDFMCHGPRSEGHSPLIHNLDVFVLVTDLVSSCPGDVQRSIIYQLNDLICTSRDESARVHNINAWIKGPGFLRLLELFEEMPITLRSQLRAMLEQMLTVCAVTELRLVVDLLLEKHSPVTPLHLDVKSEVLDSVYHAAVRQPQVLAHLQSVGGTQTLLSLMEIQSEKLRISAVKLLGLLLHMSGRVRQSFVRAQGFETLGHLLSFFPLTHELCGVLLDLAQGAYIPSSHDKCDHAREKDVRQKRLPGRSISTSSELPETSSNPSPKEDPDQPSGSSFAADPNGVVANRVDSGKVDAVGSRIVYPAAIIVVTNLLPTASYDLQVHFLDILETMVAEPTVSDVLLDASWLDFCWGLLSARTKHASQTRQAQDPDEFQQQLYSITIRMILHDMDKPPRASRIVKLREMGEAEAMQLRVIHGILDHFEQSPRFTQNDPTPTLQNLVALWSHVEDVTGFTPELGLRIMNCINLLSYQNDSPVRTSMKNLGMFEIRDNLILFTLRGDLSEQVRFETICNFSFESVAHQPKFRESNGLLYLLKIFHVAVEDPGLQTAIGEILRDVFGQHKDNLKVLANILEDKEVVSRFLGGSVSPATEPSPARGLTSSPRRARRDPSAQVEEVDLPVPQEAPRFETFLNWYYNDARKPQRLAVEHRIYNLLMPVAVAQRKREEKIAQKKETAKKTREKKLRESAGKVSKKIEASEKSRKSDLGQVIGAHTARIRELREARGNRATLGRKSWLRTKKMLRDKGVTVPSITENTGTLAHRDHSDSNLHLAGSQDSTIGREAFASDDQDRNSDAGSLAGSGHG